MNCHEAERHIFAERDGALDDRQRAALNAHVAQCESCRRMRADLTAAMDGWRGSTAAARVPDAERAWQDLRRQLRAEAPASRRPHAAWFTLPLAAAAAVAIILTLNPGAQPPSRAKSEAAQVARAEAAESTSTVVFVDDKSGWVFVWAPDDAAKHI